MKQTTNEMEHDEIDKLGVIDGSMDYHYWAQVIDSLEKAIKESMRSIAINRQFLKTAIEMQRHQEPPKETPKDQQTKG